MSGTAQTSLYTKDHPLLTRIIENRPLTAADSEKDTRHFVIALAGSGLTYAAGDALGIYPTNRPVEVEDIIERMGATGWETVTLPRGTETMTLREALLNKLSLAGPTRRALELFARSAAEPAERVRLEELLAPEAAERLAAFTAERHFVDLFHEVPSAQISAQELVDLLRRLTPRLYSYVTAPTSGIAMECARRFWRIAWRWGRRR